MGKREYVPILIGLAMEKEGTHKIVGYELFSSTGTPQTAIVVRKDPGENVSNQ